MEAEQQVNNQRDKNQPSPIKESKAKKGFPVLLVILLILLLGLIPVWFFFFRDKNEKDTLVENENMQDSVNGSPDNLNILKGASPIFVSQKTPSDILELDWLMVDVPTFVVIQKDDNGVTGEIIGYSDLRSEGPNEDIDISLEEETISGNYYYAVVYADDGDGVFDPDQDEVLNDDEGNPIQHRFLVISPTPTQTIENETNTATGAGEE